MRALVLSAAFLAACATTEAPAPSADPVIAAERAFAADAGEHGWIPAFRTFAAPDGVVIQGGEIVNARERFSALPDDGSRTLAWWPAFAAIARSGDLGFTTGPYIAGGTDEIRGHYFTVWRRQRDGAWLWIFDGGVGVTDANPVARDAVVPVLPVATTGAGSAGAAAAQVRALETANATSAAMVALLADDARVNRPRAPSAIGREAAAAMTGLDAAFTPLRAEASGAGDLVFTLGEARWTREGRLGHGHYARIWQHRPEGWRLVFDEILPAPPPQPSPG